MSDELKPCPFCGGEVRIHSKVLAEGFGSGYWAVCDECGKGDTLPHESEEEAAAAWNARAAVTDEQFAVAVHDGRAWQVVRTCEMLEVQTGEKTDYWDAEEIIWHCQSCHEERAVYAFGEDGGVWAEKPKFCPNCGAKVAG